MSYNQYSGYGGNPYGEQTQQSGGYGQSNPYGSDTGNPYGGEYGQTVSAAMGCDLLWRAPAVVGAVQQC